MCFKNSKLPKELTAEKDIVCYKVLRDIGIYKILYSFYYNKEYKINEKYIISNPLYISYNYNKNLYNIEQGFHSYSRIEQAKEAFNYLKKRSEYYGFDIKLVKCVIPEDSKYCISDINDEYVSNQIMITEILDIE